MSIAGDLIARDPNEARAPAVEHGPLQPFADAGILDAADVHVAATLLRLVDADGSAARTDWSVALAIALAVRAVRLGSVHVDLDTIADTAAVETGTLAVDPDVTGSLLDWPDPVAWRTAVESSPLVAVGDDDDAAPGAGHPLRLLGTELSLDRYWRHERSIAADIVRRLIAPPPAVRDDVLDAGLDRLFPSDDEAAPGTSVTPDRQRLAARRAVDGSFAVIAGGPGTGKTTTVAAVLALLFEQAAASGHRPPRVALAAPTGKAAARLTEAVHRRAHELRAANTVDAPIADGLLGIEASTLHRLLGRAPGSSSRFRHDRSNQLPHEVVIVDESSMVSLSLMARLLEAVGERARLVLVGDPQQLASVEAGAVLGDIVRAAEGTDQDSTPTALGERIVVLDRVHRFSGGISDLASAIEAGDAEGALTILEDQPDGVRWLPVSDADLGATTAAGGPGDGDATALALADRVRPDIVAVADRVVTAARAGDAPGALAAMGGAQILCAHRRGPAGVALWRRLVERWLTDAIEAYNPNGWFAGRPVLVTENDYGLDLFNGDTGVAVQAGDDRLQVAFERRGEVLAVSPSRLRSVETMYAMTIHKSQGSQFDHVIVVLPSPESAILTRELLYTAVTRAQSVVTLVGSADAVRAAIARPVRRASGLPRRLRRPAADSAG